MGVIKIEVPQRINRAYRIDSVDSANDVINRLDKLSKKSKKLDLSGIVGLWADRSESADEIANELRWRSNSRDGNA